MPQVQLSDGIIEGEIVDNKYGTKYYSFKGIPYAEPPLGNLRFKAPVPVKPWQGVRSAKEFGPVSFQIQDSKKIGSEDCLYVNVYTPQIKPSKSLPVMVYIHGGGFRDGSGDDSYYGPEFLVRHDVILVTVNYRLGIVGFLCLNTKEIPGNAGMKDQVLALKWVKRNINNFGGDPDNITIFGNSAGGTSIGFHLISPMSKGLFNRAIAQSGSPLNYWATNLLDPRENALAIARHFGLFSEDDNELYEFFKNLPIEQLIDPEIPTRLASKQYDLELAVVDERQFGDSERFYFGDIFEVLRKQIHEGVEIMTGYCEDEGLIAFGMPFAKKDENALFNRSNNFLEFFVPKRIAVDRPTRKQFDIGRQIKKHYFKNGLNSHDNFECLLKFINMDFFVYEIVSFAKFCANTKNNKVYLYKFTCKSERNFMTKVLNLGKLINDEIRVCHADELSYLFPLKVLELPVDEKSEAFKSINNMTRLWTNFAKYGNPTPDDNLGLRWLPYTLEDQWYLDIGNELAMESYPEKKDMEVWENIFKENISDSVV